MQNKSRPEPDECSHYTHTTGIHPIMDRRHRFPLCSVLIQLCVTQIGSPIMPFMQEIDRMDIISVVIQMVVPVLHEHSLRGVGVFEGCDVAGGNRLLHRHKVSCIIDLLIRNTH